MSQHVTEGSRAARFAELWSTKLRETPDMIQSAARCAVSAKLDELEESVNSRQHNPFNGAGAYVDLVRSNEQCFRASDVVDADFAKATELTFDLEYATSLRDLRFLSAPRQREVLPLLPGALASALEEEQFRVLGHGLQGQTAFVVITCPPLEQLAQEPARGEWPEYKTSNDGSLVG
jgi:hypothetical protein